MVSTGPTDLLGPGAFKLSLNANHSEKANGVVYVPRFAFYIILMTFGLDSGLTGAKILPTLQVLRTLPHAAPRERVCWRTIRTNATYTVFVRNATVRGPQ